MPQNSSLGYKAGDTYIDKDTGKSYKVRFETNDEAKAFENNWKQYQIALDRDALANKQELKKDDNIETKKYESSSSLGTMTFKSSNGNEITRIMTLEFLNENIKVGLKNQFRAALEIAARISRNILDKQIKEEEVAKEDRNEDITKKTINTENIKAEGIKDKNIKVDTLTNKSVDVTKIFILVEDLIVNNSNSVKCSKGFKIGLSTFKIPMNSLKNLSYAKS